MRKRVFFAVLIFVGIIGSLFALSNKKEKIEIQKASENEIISFFTQKKHLEDLPVTNPIDNNYQHDDVDEGDFIQYDQDNIYIVDYQKLYVLDAKTYTVLSEISFENFIPTEVLLTETQIILLGTKSMQIDVEIVPGRTFPYYNSECVLYVLNKTDYSIARFLSFDGSYYVTSAIIQNDLFFVLSNTKIFNPETKKFIYPQYIDSLYGKQSLSEKEVYYSEAGDNVYAIRLLGKLSLNENKKIQLKGFLGVEGVIKISDGKIVMISAIYDQISKIALHVLTLKDLQYKGYLLLRGYLYNPYSIDVYNGYLRVATSYYEADQQHNILYNISLNDFKIRDYKEIAPSETIYAIRFDKNYCYLSTFKYIDPLFIFDFSNPDAIQTIKKAEFEFVCEHIEIRQNDLLILGRDLDESMNSKGIVVGLLNKSNLSIIDLYKIKESFASTEVTYNDKALVTFNGLIVFPMYGENGQQVQVFKTSTKIEHLQTLKFEDDHILRNIVIDNKIISVSSKMIYVFNQTDYSLIKKTLYKIV